MDSETMGWNTKRAKGEDEKIFLVKQNDLRKYNPRL